MFENITFEMSLKPFKKTSDEYIRTVCKNIFRSWFPLIKNRKTVSVLLWVGDGSELLDYAGDLDTEFEWAYYLGTANNPELSGDEPEYTGLHSRKQKYIPDPPQMTYAILKRIISILKEEGKIACPGADIRVGEIFDIGPEFAASAFKYSRHTEIINRDSNVDTHGFIDSTATLLPDDRAYAAYPDGIPAGTSFALFLGRQAQVFLTDMDFDYIWLSNGLGFSADPWKTTGKLFDGEKFYPETLPSLRDKVFDFWTDFRKGCPHFPVETRGTNNSVGIDYASDGIPLYDIYNAGFGITPPPNSPWAALNDNFGLEIMGHMTRCAELPGKGFMFRYYIHDPWWVNSPWYDRYNAEPMDIYMPMAVTRINENGDVETASMLNVLTIDNSYGDMPDACVNEPLPHILKAEKDVSDEAAPLIWVYPLREFTTAHGEDALREMLTGDTYISNAINFGLPLNCVVSSDNFLKTDRSVYERSVLVSPVQPEDTAAEKLYALAESGIKVIIYGTNDALKKVKDTENIITVDTSSDPATLLTALAKTGYEIKFACGHEYIKPTAMTVIRHDNGLFFSTYNCDTTVETRLKFPLGAPILLGCDTCLSDDGFACYRFGRSEHRECRIFVKQSGGFISAKEEAPVNNVYKRRFVVTGFNDATVYYFPERQGIAKAKVSTILKGDTTPEFDPCFKFESDPVLGDYYVANHLTGDRAFLMTR